MPIDQLTPAEARALAAAGALLVDVREGDEWDDGHAEGAIHLPLSELHLRWQELPAAERTVFVCRSGVRSQAAAEAFAAAGRDGCANLAGGMLAWVRDGWAVVGG